MTSPSDTPQVGVGAAPDETRLRHSIRAHKGHFTRAIASAAQVIAFADANSGEQSARELSKVLDQLRQHYDKISALYLELADEFPELEPDCSAKMDELASRYLDCTGRLLAALKSGQAVPGPTTRAPPPSHGAAGTYRVQTALQPDKLSREATPAEMRSWARRFKSFYSTSNLDRATLPDQQAFFLSYLDLDLETTVREEIDDSTTIFGDDSCLAALERRFAVTYPLFTRRLDYFRYRQEVGQTFADFVAKLRQKGNEADLGSLTLDEIYVFRILSGLSDQKLKEKLLELKSPTLAKLIEEATDIEVARRNLKASSAEGASVAVAKISRELQGSQSRGRTGNRGKSEARHPTEGRCGKCGNSLHEEGYTCPADVEGRRCHNCGKKGHFFKARRGGTIICRQPVREKAGRSQSKKAEAQVGRYATPESSECESEDSFTSSASKVSKIRTAVRTARARPVKDGNAPTPKLDLQLSTEDGTRRFVFAVTPDSGATRTVFAYDVIRRQGLHPCRDGRIVLEAANGEVMSCVGTVKLRATLNGVTTTINGIVSKDLHDEVLLSWHDLRELRVLPRNFPQPLATERARAPVVQQQLGARSDTRSYAAVAADRLDGCGSACVNKVGHTGMGVTTCSSLEEIKVKFSDVLGNTLDEAAGVMKGPKMHIHLRPDSNVRPISVTTARQVPKHYEGMAAALIEELKVSGVLVPETGPTLWCSPAHFVPKPGGQKVRLVTDYRRLNEAVIRTVHPFPAAADLIKKIDSGSKYFAKIDAIHGYFQIPLDEESSKLTTFLLPSGRYRYLGAPMGLNTSSDEFCCRTDKAVEGLPWLLKIVDDMLVQAPDLPTLYERLEVVLQRCRRSGIKISLAKLEVGTSIKFAGFIVSGDGVRPNPEKLAAVAEFPAPKNASELRGFLGLVNQLGHFIPDVSHMSRLMRGLLKKEVAFNWLPCHEAEFTAMKKALTSEMVVRPFDPALPTQLLTDASRLYGIGFALIQYDSEGKIRLVSCGSRSLTKCQQNYATIELECLAIVWALEKSGYYLRGMPFFEVVTDHKPLLGVFNKALQEISNDRLLRFREKVVNFNFKLTWTAGKEHLIADALSRAPVFPGEDDADYTVMAMRVRVTGSDPALQPLLEWAKSDPEYVALVQCFRAGGDPAASPLLRQYASVWPEVSLHDLGDTPLLVLQGSRILVPRPARAGLLKLLHASHSGVVKTYQRARQLYYWPDMKNAVAQLVQGCSMCQERLPSQPLEPIQELSVPDGPMSHVAVDIFDFRGEQWLVMVDRYSGFPVCQRLRTTTTANVTGALLMWFFEWGFPQVVRSDGGPQFRDKFAGFCKTHGIIHELSSPYHPRSNGLAESAVKAIKFLLGKCRDAGEDFSAALLEWRNTPREDGFSPAEAFLGRRQRTYLPMLPGEKFDREKFEAVRNASRNAKRETKDKSAHSLSVLTVGCKVRMQHPVSKAWDACGVISKVHSSGRSYDVVCDDSGKTYRRNRRFLRNENDNGSASAIATSQNHNELSLSGPTNKPPTCPHSIIRRSERLGAGGAKKSIDFAKQVQVCYF